uniref:Uncharacterized protein n=1 Tax=Romanomermis culicivorax TaxID=13658 RepID=A0A915HPK4_ROMCU
MVTHDER